MINAGLGMFEAGMISADDILAMEKDLDRISIQQIEHDARTDREMIIILGRFHVGVEKQIINR